MIIWEDWLLCLPPAILLALAAWLMRRQSGTWSAAGPMTAFTWTALTWLALLLAPDFRVWPVTVWVILAMVIIVHFGSVAGEALVAGIPAAAPASVEIAGLGRRTVIIGSAMGVFAVFYMLRSLGESLTSLLSVVDLVLLAGRMSVRRYEQSYLEPMITRVLMAGPYAAAFIAGTAAGLHRGGRLPRWVWLPVIPAILLAGVTTARAIILYTVVMWIGGWAAGRVFRGQEFPRIFTPRIVRNGVGGFLLALGAATLLQAVRHAGTAPSIILYQMRIWFFGYLAGLSQWLEFRAAAEMGTTYGAYTFAGVYNLLGFADRSMGIFTDFVVISDGMVTNIYTVIRSVLQDFGVVGGAVASFIFGAVGGVARGATRRGYTTAIPVLAIFYALVLFGFITSLFNYNSILLACLLFAAIFPVAHIIRILGRSRST